MLRITETPDILCKEANAYQPQNGRLLGNPRFPFSKPSLESLLLLHLLLAGFMNFVVEHYGQQGAAMGVRCVKVKRGFIFVHGQMMSCQSVRKDSSNCPQ